MTITRDDWLQAIAAAADNQVDPDRPDIVTTLELSVLLGRSRPTASRLLSDMVRRGVARRTRKRIRTSDGRVYPAIAYQLVEAPDVAVPARTQPRRRRS